jgi:hypothetical protein
MKRLLSFVVMALLLPAKIAWGAAPASTPAQDLEPIGLEIKAANDLAFFSWNLPEIQNRYQIALNDLKKFRLTHAEWYPDLMQITQRDLEAKLEIVDWEIAGASLKNPDDPHGLLNVVAQLQARFSLAQAYQKVGRPKQAQQLFESCSLSWVELENMHPSWQPAMVWQQIVACRQKLAPFRELQRREQLKKNPYYDPKLGTPLSV